MSLQNRILVLDNGGYTCKVGWSTDANPRSIANYAVRPKRDTKIYVADEVDEVTDTSGMYFRRPMEKGVVLNWDLQSQIWNRILNMMETTPKDTNLMLLEAPFALQEKLCHEVIFEKFGFQSLHRCMSPAHAARGFAMEDPASMTPLPCSLVVDSGYSYSHIVPIYNNKPIRAAVQRVNIGGRHLTNLLKQTLSTRYFDLQQETQIVNDIKHKLCFVSTDFEADLAISKLKKAGQNTLRREYFLPDFLTTFQGHVRDPALSVMQVPVDGEQPFVPLSNERFSIPEMLFRPADVGISQCGLAEAVMQSLAKCPPELVGPLLSNIICVGGTFMMPQAAQRLQKDIRALAPDVLPVRVHTSLTPTLTNWHGAAAFVNACGSADAFTHQFSVSKAEWADMGESAIARKCNV